MSYDFYKLLHFASIFGFAMAATALFYQDIKNKKLSALIGILGMVILVAGMGMMARLGVGFLPWIWMKLAIWFVIMGLAPVLAKKMKLSRAKGIALFWILLLIPALIAVLKPGS